MRTLTRSAVALLLIAGLGACSSGGSDDDADRTTTTAEAEGATSDPVEETTTTEADEGTTTTSDDEAEGSEADYVEAIATSLGTSDESGLVVTPEEADCVAPEWVDVIGVDTFVDAGVAPADVAEDTFTPDELGLDVDQGLELIDAFEGCDVDVYAQYFDVLSEGLDDTQKACLEGEFDQELSRQFLAEALTQPEPSAELEATLDDIDQTCQLSAG